MALEPVRLDDLTWQGMVDTIRRRIPAASAGEWTLHAPVDPGVTLLELLAWLLEQRVYWLDQTPDALLRAALKLLGLASKRTAIATTVLSFEQAAFAKVAAGTEMQLPARTPKLVFSTGFATTLLPVERVEVYVDGADRTQDLRHGRLFRLFPSDGTTAAVKLLLWLTDQIPATPPPDPFALLFEIDAPKSVEPQWSKDAVSTPPPAKVTWWYPAAATGRLREFPLVEDGTGGLRRSGVVRLPFPADWKMENVASPPAGLYPYAIHLQTERATFATPPRLKNLHVNAIAAAHQRLTRRHSLQRTWLPLPGNALDLASIPENEPEKDYPPIEATIRLRIRERDGKWYDWSPVADLTFGSPSQRVFVVDRKQGALRFGDGYTGRVPVLDDGGPNIEVQYAVGGGPEGNLGSNREWIGPNDLAAISPVSADGGAEPQTPAEAVAAAPSELRKPTRAVTRADYESLAKTTKGVAITRAHAAVGLHPCRPCQVSPGAVTVFVVPDVPREEEDEDLRESAFVVAPVPDPGTLAAVRAHLDAARLLTAEVFVAPPRYRAVSLMVNVEGDPVDAAGLRSRVNEALRDFLDPLIGGDDRQGWPFGEPLRPSVLLREAQKAAGDDGAVTSVEIRVNDAMQGQSCLDVAIGEHDLVYLTSLRLDLRRSASTTGGLR